MVYWFLPCQMIEPGLNSATVTLRGVLDAYRGFGVYGFRQKGKQFALWITRFAFANCHYTIGRAVFHDRVMLPLMRARILSTHFPVQVEGGHWLISPDCEGEERAEPDFYAVYLHGSTLLNDKD